MERLLNQLKFHSQRANCEFVNPTIGVVSSYDPDNYCCKIKIQSIDADIDTNEIISGWIPVGTIWAGNGWGLLCPPSVGDVVEIDFQESDFEAGHVDWRFYNETSRPVRAESGVFYIIHKDGASLKFENGGKVTLNTTAELDLGNINQSLHKLVTDTFVSLFNSHTHPIVGVKAGPDTVTTQKTTSTMSDDHLTSIVKAN